MTQFDRRTVLGGLALTGSVFAGSGSRAAPLILPLSELKKEAEVACVYHCDFGEPGRISQMLNNIANHYQAYGADPFAVQLAVVAHSAGVKFMLEKLDATPWKDDAAAIPALFEKAVNLAKNGLKVYLCDITFERLKLERANARVAPFISFVPSGVATVAALQSKGFAYLKAG